MPKSPDKTTPENLEEKFDQGEDVLDYFDVSKARAIRPQSKSITKTKVGWSPKQFATPCGRSGESRKGISEIEGKVARVVTSELGNERVSNRRIIAKRPDSPASRVLRVSTDHAAIAGARAGV
jgi:hypothetical protein